MYKSIGLFAFLAVSAAAMGQGMVVSTTGNASVNGGAFVSGNVLAGSVLTLSGSPSSLTASPGGDGSEFGGNRMMVEFNSFGSGTVNMPTDSIGSVASESAGSGSSVFASWDTIRYGEGPQLFNAGITDDPNNDTSLTMDVENAPIAHGTQAGGTFTHDFLPGVVNQSYVANLNMNMPSYNFSRSLASFQDGTTAVSPYTELVSSGVWVVLGDASNSFAYIFEGPFGTTDPTAQTIASGSITNQLVGPWSNTDTFSFSLVAPGTYTVTYYAISWDTFGLPDGTLEGDTTGDFQQFDRGVINVVPEPTPFAILGLGALCFLRRRKAC